MRIFWAILGLIIPLSARAATTATDCSYNAVRAALTIAPVNTVVIVPAGTATWSQQLLLSRGVSFQGAGKNLTHITLSIPNPGGNFNGGAILVNNNDPCEISGFDFIGDGNRDAFAISWSPGGGKVTDCRFTGFQIALYDNNSWGGAFQCEFVNNQVSGRVYGNGVGCANWNTYYPISFSSTNYFFFEDCSFTINTSFGSGSHAFVSSGQGSSYVVRHCTFAWSADQLSPAFDWHGDQATDGTRGNLSAQVYGNTFAISGSGSLNNLIDGRGGQSQSYSNVITGGTFGGANQIRYREEYPGGTSACGGTYFDVVTNAWDCLNSWNGNALTGYCEANCGLMSFHPLTCFTPYTAPPYPHPLNTGGGLPPPPPIPGSVSYSASSYQINETGGSVVVIVNRILGTDGAVSVTATTSNGTATSGHDYTATSTVLNWADGATGARSFSIPILNSGDIAVTNRTFTVTLSAATGGVTIASPATITVTIVMTRPTGTIQWTSNAYGTTETSGAVTLTATRIGGSSGVVSASYSTANGTAAAGHDYTASAGTVSFADGVTTSVNVSIPILFSGDTALTNRTFNVTLSGAPLGSPTVAIVTITMNPPLPTGNLQFTSSTFNTAEASASVALTVQRFGGSSGAISVSYVTANGTALAGRDYVAKTNTLAWANGDTGNKALLITLVNSGDTSSTPRTFTVSLFNPTGGAGLGNSVATVVIAMTPPQVTSGGTIRLSAASYSASETGGSVTLSIIRSGGTNQAVSVNYSTSNGSASAGTDYTTTSGALSWTANQNTTQTVVVPILDSGTPIGPSRSFFFTLTSPTGGSIVTLGQAQVSITMDSSVVVAITNVVQLKGNIKLQGSIKIGGR